MSTGSAPSESTLAVVGGIAVAGIAVTGITVAGITVAGIAVAARSRAMAIAISSRAR
ncbi:MAG TPA: hypothetical protein VK698_24660 [Kofleriaceae bacterium]|nr:hypothetical protein [Kofleriaceae bacterium]